MYTEREPYLATPWTDSCWKIGITLRFRDYTIDRLGVMGQKAEKMLLKIINEWLCNVQLFPKLWILKILIKAFRISGSESGSRLKAVFGYPYPVVNSLSCLISNRQTGWWSSLLDTGRQRWPLDPSAGVDSGRTLRFYGNRSQTFFKNRIWRYFSSSIVAGVGLVIFKVKPLVTFGCIDCSGVWFSILKRFWTRIHKFWNRSGVWKSDSGHLCSALEL